MNKYYIYIHRRLSDNKVFYVGKGCGRRAFRGDKTARTERWLRVANKYGWKVELVFENLTEDEAYELEVDTIKEFKYFNEPLVNFKKGGGSGRPPTYSEVLGKRISESLKDYYKTHNSPMKGKEGLKLWSNGHCDIKAWLNLPLFYSYFIVGTSYSTFSKIFPDVSKTTFKKIYHYFKETGDPILDKYWLEFSSKHSIPILYEIPTRALKTFRCDELIINISKFDFYVKQGFGDKRIASIFNVTPSSVSSLKEKITNGYDYRTDTVMQLIHKRLDHLANTEYLDEE